MADHKDLTAPSVHVPGFIQGTGPSAALSGAGKLWFDNSQGENNYVMWIRNAANSAWVRVTTPGELRVHNTTNDNTPTELFLDGAAVRMTIPSDTTWFFDIYVAARRTDADDESAGYVFRGVIDNNAGTTALVGAVSSVYTNEDTAAWAVAVTADNANDALVITVTGEAGKTISWAAKVKKVEVTG